jgi:hypothetical protein
MNNNFTVKPESRPGCASLSIGLRHLIAARPESLGGSRTRPTHHSLSQAGSPGSVRLAAGDHP